MMVPPIDMVLVSTSMSALKIQMAFILIDVIRLRHVIIMKVGVGVKYFIT